MKIILVGYPGSQKIVKASQYLVNKYIPGFDVHWLCYEGEINGWSSFIADYLEKLNDKVVVFALDDYLLSHQLNQSIYDHALSLLNDRIVAVKLCKTNAGEHAEYPVTTQYTLWDREYLVNLLRKTTTPWDFEVSGSRIMANSSKDSVFSSTPALEYPVHSCLSSRWEGIRLEGNEHDLEEINTLL